MRFKIGNDIILGGDSAYKLVSPISGLSAPAIRTADGVYAGVDGGYVSSQLYAFRTITLSGFYQIISISKLLGNYNQVLY